MRPTEQFVSAGAQSRCRPQNPTPWVGNDTYLEGFPANVVAVSANGKLARMKPGGKLFAVQRDAQEMPLELEVLSDWAEWSKARA